MIEGIDSHIQDPNNPQTEYVHPTPYQSAVLTVRHTLANPGVGNVKNGAIDIDATSKATPPRAKAAWLIFSVEPGTNLSAKAAHVANTTANSAGELAVDLASSYLEKRPYRSGYIAPAAPIMIFEKPPRRESNLQRQVEIQGERRILDDEIDPWSNEPPPGPTRRFPVNPNTKSADETLEQKAKSTGGQLSQKKSEKLDGEIVCWSNEAPPDSLGPFPADLKTEDVGGRPDGKARSPEGQRLRKENGARVLRSVECADVKIAEHWGKIGHVHGKKSIAVHGGFVEQRLSGPYPEEKRDAEESDNEELNECKTENALPYWDDFG